MILVRHVFQAKLGTAGNVIEEYKQNMDAVAAMLAPGIRIRFLTDLSGPFDTVVQEVELESLAEWESYRAALFANPEFQEAMENRESPFISGRAEFYTIEATIGG